MEQEQPGLHGFTFRNIWALDQPPLAGSTLTGDVGRRDIRQRQVRADGRCGRCRCAFGCDGGAQQPQYTASRKVEARFSFDPPVFGPGQEVTFTAKTSAGARYTWLFGDGTVARGRIVSHRFADAEGTELDGAGFGAGRFRVLLHAEDKAGEQDWAAQGVVAVAKWNQPVNAAIPTLPGLTWQIYPGSWTELPDLTRQQAIFNGESPNINANPQGFTRYAAVWDGLIDIPADGGYTFHLLDRDGARLRSTEFRWPRRERHSHRCAALRATPCATTGEHWGCARGTIRFIWKGCTPQATARRNCCGRGQALPLAPVPQAAYSHARQDAVMR